MNWYEKLNSLGMKKSYAMKFLLVAFLGIHCPLITLLTYLVLTHQLESTALAFAIVILAATLVGTAATLFIQYQLLEPIRLAEKALEDYQTSRKLPNLPIGFPDEAGRLLTQVQSSLVHLDELIAEKEQVMTSLSHDLRSPLSSIVSAVELIEESEPHPDSRALLEMIKETAVRELAQINDVIVAARLDRDELQLSKTLIDVSSLLKEVSRHAQFTARQKAVTFSVESPMEQTYVSADRPRILQALNNLVFHALKITPVGGAVGLKVMREGSSCRFIVQDTSAGMTSDQQEEIREYFRDSNEAASRADTALGLRICSHLVKLHGGKIEVESAPGRGTKLSFLLGGS